MAQTTVELGRLLRTNFELFDFPYQWDDPVFKAQLEERVIDFYYDYEIGQETPDMFKRKFKSRWNRIIGYYNKLYNTTLLTYNPLTNYSVSEALEQLSQSSSTTDSTEQARSGNNSNTKNSDYPQQAIAGGDFLQGESLSTSDTTTDGSGKSTSIGDSNSSYSKTVEGLTGTSYQELISKERENILNIYDMVIEELKPCFILTF
jgi:hypothetical protein